MNRFAKFLTALSGGSTDLKKDKRPSTPSTAQQKHLLLVKEFNVTMGICTPLI